MAAPLALLALLFELMVGYPAALARSIGHPVTWMGQLIAWLDRRLNRDDASSEARRRAGAVALLVLLVVVGAVAFIVEQTLLLLPFGLLFAAVAASTMLAQRGLVVHVGQVADALDDDGIDAGREAVAHIVGRDTTELDQPGVARAAIESLAENFSDGVVAPTFWMVIAGLPGAALYKAINTADSMIGHRSPRYLDFGRFAARLDDVACWLPARLSALLILAAACLSRGATPAAGWRALRRDAAKHRSVNAGWPEAAMAGSLGLRLAGPRRYAGQMVEDAWMGDGTPLATTADTRRALKILVRACILTFTLLALALLALAPTIATPAF
jgi:adenosylcobinamide-phosphate synthase